jgi:hypothetical protein
LDQLLAIVQALLLAQPLLVFAVQLAVQQPFAWVPQAQQEVLEVVFLFLLFVLGYHHHKF